ncbi:MAG: DUF2914 domain-containing protein [Candidatus Kaiserbacteria bacterium]|nr:DUF2914 domain-containing protein [Candidatus Kaiserbacteria bacterium]
MYRKLFSWIQKYERHLSALAMIAGFVCDNLLFERVDLWQTQLWLASFSLACFITIPWLHFIEARVARGRPRPRWRFLLPLITQFALGGFWSAFVIFYGRSAVFSASWPFLLLLFLVFLANEYFHKYHSRLVFTSVLFFFALYSCTIFEVPIYTGTIGTWTFIESSLVAVCLFALFTILLRILGREKFLADVQRIRVGALCVLVVINVFYFTNILPPLPLSAEAAGIYHSVTRVSGTYAATGEEESWQVHYLGFAPVLHIISGESLYAYSSVFAPTTLTTAIVHRWQLFDSSKKQWVTKSVINYHIVGGRDGGYRGYSAVPISEEGEWRVDVETIDGRLIARLPFTVEIVTTPPPETTITLD